MPFFNLDSVVAEQVAPGVKVRNIYLKSTMMSVVDYDDGAVIPPHRHLHEQISFVVEGEIEESVEGKTKVLKAGDVVAVPSNVLHSSRALKKSRVICSSSPVMKPYKFKGETK